MLELKDICKKFGDNEILKDVSFTTENGRVLGLLGRNGAGKSTIIRIIMGIFYQDSGQVLIDGISNDKSKVKLGYLPEERGLYPKKTVLEQMVYLGEIRGMKASQAKKAAKELLERLEAEEYLNKKLDALSKGNQQKIQMAIAVIHDPDIIILDEPFSGLDPVNASILKKLVVDKVKEGKTLVFSSHQMPYVEEFCQHICIISNGKVVLNGNISDIKKTYPREKILITPERDIEGFINKIKAEKAVLEHVKEITSLNDSVVISLNNPKSKDFLWRHLQQLELPIDTFMVMEPTLEEIFVEKAEVHCETNHLNV